MKKSIKILIICVLAAALIAGGVIYLIYQTRDDELLIGDERAQQIALSDARLAENQVSKLKVRLKLEAELLTPLFVETRAVPSSVTAKG